jgi:hypothetical protein
MSVIYGGYLSKYNCAGGISRDITTGAIRTQMQNAGLVANDFNGRTVFIVV